MLLAAALTLALSTPTYVAVGDRDLAGCRGPGYTQAVLPTVPSRSFVACGRRVKVGADTRYISLSASGFGRTHGIAAAERRLPKLRRRLIVQYTDLLRRAPDATVVVLGYPRRYAGCHGTTERFTESLNGTILEAISAVRQARPAQQGQLRYADAYAASLPHHCRGGTPGATLDARGRPTRSGRKLFVALVEQAFAIVPPPLTTIVTPLSPVTPDGALAPGFTVARTRTDGNCEATGNVYRCLVGNGIYKTCFALADPGTGDGTSAACLYWLSNRVDVLSGATGLSRLETLSSDQPFRLVLAGGIHCQLTSGATDRVDGRAVDYLCDDPHITVLHGLHRDGPLWTADIAHYVEGGTRETVAGSLPITSAEVLAPPLPPANRPVTDATAATDTELDAPARLYHEVDCGNIQPSLDSPGVQELYINAADCYAAHQVVAAYDHHDKLPSGWTCRTSTRGNVLCDRAPTPNAGVFFAATHVRAIAVMR